MSKTRRQYVSWTYNSLIPLVCNFHRLRHSDCLRLYIPSSPASKSDKWILYIIHCTSSTFSFYLKACFTQFATSFVGTSPPLFAFLLQSLTWGGLSIDGPNHFPLLFLILVFQTPHYYSGHFITEHFQLFHYFCWLTGLHLASDFHHLLLPHFYLSIAHLPLSSSYFLKSTKCFSPTWLFQPRPLLCLCS